MSTLTRQEARLRDLALLACQRAEAASAAAEDEWRHAVLRRDAQAQDWQPPLGEPLPGEAWQGFSEHLAHLDAAVAATWRHWQWARTQTAAAKATLLDHEQRLARWQRWAERRSSRHAELTRRVERRVQDAPLPRPDMAEALPETL